MEIYTTERKKAKKALGLIPEHQHVLVIDDCLSPSVLEDLLDLLYISADETIEISVFCKGTPQSARVIEKDYAKVEHFHIFGRETVNLIPVSAGDNRHTGNGEILVQHIKGSRIPAAAAAYHRSADFHLLGKVSAVEKPVQKREKRSVGGSVINRAADDQPVRAFKLRSNFVDKIIKNAFAGFSAAVACNTAPDILFSDLDQLGFNALFFQGYNDFVQGCGGAPTRFRAAV